MIVAVKERERAKTTEQSRSSERTRTRMRDPSGHRFLPPSVEIRSIETLLLLMLIGFEIFEPGERVTFLKQKEMRGNREQTERQARCCEVRWPLGPPRSNYCFMAKVLLGSSDDSYQEIPGSK